ncbi:hypothetical protein BO83DRAFT_43475 [Aspergillus eucalypticola CBS 122712]|uniref:Uncharacterized protein n=1 Tax=Aspergillus eucalypticola (strain CBS 122712 / IBT 29274) TaxID=1448314 RepID=A0A317VCC2_ASPEC|nr:uncharacterized protein BO83DRAFT_43475 [Aspergillus eucalypticola CBS 122712]PWY71886.1 hypothetical protein BO83DRAFT_43475 [Aspergillus eucalypticola CBS 122712]
MRSHRCKMKASHWPDADRITNWADNVWLQSAHHLVNIVLEASMKVGSLTQATLMPLAEDYSCPIAGHPPTAFAPSLGLLKELFLFGLQNILCYQQCRHLYLYRFLLLERYKKRGKHTMHLHLLSRSVRVYLHAYRPSSTSRFSVPKNEVCRLSSLLGPPI